MERDRTSSRLYVRGGKGHRRASHGMGVLSEAQKEITTKKSGIKYALCSSQVGDSQLY